MNIQRELNERKNQDEFVCGENDKRGERVFLRLSRNVKLYIQFLKVI